MSNITIVTAETIGSYMKRNVAFLGFASYEERSKSASVIIDSEKVDRAVVFYDEYYTPAIVASEIAAQYKHSSVKPLSISNPVLIADIFAKVIDDYHENGITALLIDITTFTHEALLILLKIIFTYKDHFTNIYCLYTGADSYGGLTTPPDQKWLSKGCKDVRNILGYPGMLKPSAKTCLVILAGFEIERATKIIEMLEPDRIILGNGIDPTSDSISKTMTYFRGKFDDWIKEYKSRACERFDFSCKDIQSTVQSLDNLLKSSPNDNYILIPLNTKLSTVAAASFALQNPKVQVCYSIPEIYNTENYSTSSNKISFFELKELSPFGS
jgi:hypothetical protein